MREQVFPNNFSSGSGGLLHSPNRIRGIIRPEKREKYKLSGRKILLIDNGRIREICTMRENPKKMQKMKNISMKKFYFLD